MQQPMEERLAQRQHHADVQQALPVVLQDAEQAAREDHGEIDGARAIEVGEARRHVQRSVEQDAVDDEPDEQRLDHLEAGGHQREHEDRGDRVPVRPQPAQVLAHGFAPLAATLVGRFGFPFVAALGRVVQPSLAVVPAEVLVAVTRRAWACQWTNIPIIGGVLGQ